MFAPIRLFLIASLYPCFLTAQVFTRPIEGATSLAMGGAVTAYPGADIGIANEAAIAATPDLALFAGSALPYTLAGWQSGWINVAFPLGQHSGAGLLFHHSGLENLYAEQRFAVAYGRKLGQYIYVGASAGWLRVAAAEYGAASGVDANMAALARVRPQLWLGVRVLNPVSGYFNGQRLPTGLRTGVCWEASSVLHTMAEVEKYPGQPGVTRAGIAYRPAPKVVIRLGWQAAPAAPSLGCGFVVPAGWQIEMATQWSAVLGFTPAIQIAWHRKALNTKV